MSARSRAASFVVLVYFAVLTSPASAQFWSRNGDQLTLTIEHPAPIKAPLEHIAFQPPQGPCGEAFSDALVADFATSGALVIDRLHLKNIAAEHKVNVSSGLVDPKTAAKIGRLIGAGSLVFVKVHECKTHHTKEANRSLDVKGNISKEQVPTTRGLLKASVQVVNMTTGMTVGAALVDAKAAVHALDNASMKERVLNVASKLKGKDDDAKEEQDEYPPEDMAITAVFAEAVQQVHRKILPWTETRKIHFYNDRECGLAAAYNLLAAADYEGASREALGSVEQCQNKSNVKPVQKARAHFNYAMTLYLLEDYLGAMSAFGQAVRLDATNKVYTEAMAECNKAWSESQAAGVGKKKPGGASAPPATKIAEKSTPSASPAGKPAPEPKTAASTEERLKKLDELYKKKMITEEEYAQKRKQILEDI
jgi:hypothetical protein